MMRSTSSDHAPMRRIHNRGIRAWRSLYSSYHILSLYDPTTIFNFQTTINIAPKRYQEKKKENVRSQINRHRLALSLSGAYCMLSIYPSIPYNPLDILYT